MKIENCLTIGSNKEKKMHEQPLNDGGNGKNDERLLNNPSFNEWFHKCSGTDGPHLLQLHFPLLLASVPTITKPNLYRLPVALAENQWATCLYYFIGTVNSSALVVKWADSCEL